MSKNLLITIGNVYLDHNAFGINTDEKDTLEAGKEYFADRYETVLGGSAVNFAMQARRLGMQVAFLGQIGEDEEGGEIKRLLQEYNIISDLVYTTKGETTSAAFNMILSHNGEFIGIHWGSASRTLSPDQIDVTHPLFQQSKAVYFGGTAKQEKIFTSFPMILKQLQQEGIKTFIDPNRFPVTKESDSRNILLESLEFVDCYLPNEDEIKQLTRQDDLDQALDTVLKRGAKLVIVKCGAKGCRIKTDNKDIAIPGFHTTPVTTVGAGDSFNAGFITDSLNGKSLEESARFGNAIAAIKVGQNRTPNRSEVEDFIKEY